VRRAFASLTSRLVVTAVSLVALVALLIAASAAVALHSYMQDQVDHDVQGSLGRVPHGVAQPPGDGDADNGRPDVSRMGTLSGVVGFSEATAEVYTDDGWTPLDRGVLGALAAVPPDGKVHVVSLPELGGYRVAAQPATVRTRSGIENALVVAGLPTSAIDRPVHELIGWEALFGLLGVAAAAGVGTYVVRRQLRPLREVARTAHDVSALPLAEGEISIAHRVPEHLTDARTEVGQVGAALNTLLAHVESSLTQRHRSEQQVRQFVADASHELRTPLTTIAGYTELARRRWDDEATVRTALAKVEDESARMTSMVEDLLLLARLDAGRPLARDPLDLSRLLVEAVSDARVVAPDHRWRLELPEESVEVTGDADRLHQVVTNLLANARKHTPSGTTVTVTGTTYGFSVHDDGPGFPPGLAEAAFERFVRGDVSRTRTPGGTAGGAGLGLALVDAIVSAHGGSVTLDSSPGSTTITVSLPG